MAPPIGFVNTQNVSIGNDSVLENIRCTLASAQREANRRPEMALRLLREIHDDIQSYDGTIESVEYHLLQGVALSAGGPSRRRLAETPLREALERANRLLLCPADLLIRVYESFGEFYMREAVTEIRPPSSNNESFWKFHDRDKHKLISARQFFELAEEFAARQGLKQDTARVQLRIICADLLKDLDPEVDNFQTLRRVAKDGGFIWTEEIEAWSKHSGGLKELGRQFAAARGFRRMNEAYFVDLLKSARKKDEE